MSEESTIINVVLAEDSPNGSVEVALDSFMLFDNSVTHGLDALERRWSDFATPASLRREIWENFER